MAESTTTVKHDVTVDFGGIELTGALVHDSGILGLAGCDRSRAPVATSPAVAGPRVYRELPFGRGSGSGENRARGR